MGLVSKYPDGADISVLNTFYLYPKKGEDGKYDKGSLTVVYKDNVDNSKHMQCYEDPNYEFYITKDGVYLDCHELYINKDNVVPVRVPYRNLVKKAAELTDNLDVMYANLQNGNRSENRKILTNARLFLADMNIEDKYRLDFCMQYTNAPNDNITKAFFDIEVDGIDQAGDFPELGECPINAVSYINPIDNTIYVFLLRNPKNPLIQEFEDSLGEDVVIELKDFIRNQVGGWKNEIRYGLKDTKFKFLFYNEEIQLIQDLFIIINHFKPDFLLAWNMAFDIPYIIERIKVLGYNPEDIMCHPDFPHKVCKYFIDNVDRRTGKFKEFGERGDKATIASYTVFLDQLIQFASRRKGQSKFQGNKLDYIGEVISGVHKLDYSHITTKIAELPYKDYKTFVFYNIMDTIVQLTIEYHCNDIDYIYNKCTINNTRYDKGHRQVTYLPNRFAKNLMKSGYIMGTNANAFNKKPEEKYDGAYVANPLHLSDYSKHRIDNRPVNIYDNVIDFDFSAQYPNAAVQNNMAPYTQIGKINIPNQIDPNENPFNKSKFNRGGKLLEDYMTRNWISFGHRWLKLGNFNDLIHDVLYYCNNVKLSRRNPNIFMHTDSNRLVDVMRNVPRVQQKDNLVTVMRPVTDDSKLVNVMTKLHPMPEHYYDIAKEINIDKVVYKDDIRDGKSLI